MLRTRMTLKPGRPGTKRLFARYGDRLVCVRYRYDDERNIRYKTVELIVEEAPWIPRGSRRYAPTELVHVRLHYTEESLRAAVKLLGGRYSPATKTWRLAYAAVAALRLTDRLTTDSDIPPNSGR